MNRIFVLSGLLLTLGCGYLLQGLINDKDIQENGITVKAIIVDKSNSCNGSRSKSMTVKYNQGMFVMDIDKSYCERHSVGDTVVLRSPSSSVRLILPEKNYGKEIVFNVVLILIGITLIIYGLITPKRKSSTLAPLKKP
jgi:hypothetical protein